VHFLFSIFRVVQFNICSRLSLVEIKMTLCLSFSSSWSPRESKEFDKTRSVSWSGQVTRCLMNNYVFISL
jgi:hypothetical protein